MLGSGFDDGAQLHVKSHSSRYKSTILEMLQNSTSGSFNAEASFAFAELLLDDPHIKSQVNKMSQSHSERQIRCYWHDVIHERFELIKISGDELQGFATYSVKDHGSSCP